jgi:hypothetical protein
VTSVVVNVDNSQPLVFLQAALHLRRREALLDDHRLSLTSEPRIYKIYQ